MWMNHDYAHCINCRPDCPSGCFRAQLSRDLLRYGKLAPYAINFPVSYMHFRGTDECPRGGGKNE